MSRTTVGKRRRRVINGALVITAVALAWTAARQLRRPQSLGLAQGTVFPSLHLVDGKGDTLAIEIAEDAREKLIVFYSSSCPFCRQSLPIYRAVSQRCDPSMVIVLTDLSGSAMAAWWEDTRDGFSERCDSIAVGSPLGSLSAYQVRGTPTHYLIDSDGRVKHRFEGVLTEMPPWLIQ